MYSVPIYISLRAFWARPRVCAGGALVLRSGEWRRVCGRAINVTWSTGVTVETLHTRWTDSTTHSRAPTTTPYSVRTLYTYTVHTASSTGSTQTD